MKKRIRRSAAHVALLSIMFSMLLLPSCGGKEEGKEVESKATVEAAKIAGREAARSFVASRWKDTVQLQILLLEARAKGSKYMEVGQPVAAAAFDSAFVSTVRTVRPDIAAHLNKDPRKNANLIEK